MRNVTQTDWVIAGVLLLLTGCASRHINTSYLPSNPSEPARPPRPVAAVSLLYSPQRPDCEFRVVGRVHSERNGNYVFHIEDDESLRALGAEAAKDGLDGVMDVECAAHGTLAEQDVPCTGKGYVCEGSPRSPGTIGVK